MNQTEREYREALDEVRFSQEAKERMMKNLMEQTERAPVKRHSFRPLRSGLIAAMLCMALLGTAGAAQFFGMRVDLQSNPDHPGDNYTATGGIAFFPADSFSQEVHDLAAPSGMTGKNFASWAELEEFLGRELPSSTALEAARPGPYTKVSGSQKGTHILLKAYTTDQGLASIGAEGSYLLDGVWIQQSAHIYTDKMEQNYQEYGLEGEKFEGGVIMIYEEGSVMTEETYTTPGGLTAAIVCVAPPTDSVRAMTEYNAHFSINGIQYRVGAAPYRVGMTVADSAAAEDPVHTLAVLKQVLDSFE